MIEDCVLKFKKYKCFRDEYTIVNSIVPINIIIGKNNVGKSSFIDIIEYLCNPTPSKLEDIDIVFGINITEEYLKSGISYIDENRSWINKKMYFKLYKNLTKEFQYTDFVINENQKGFLKNFEHTILSPFSGKVFCKVAAERNILPEKESQLTSLDFINYDGSGYTNYIQNLVNDNILFRDLFEIKLLEALNEITSPDIEFSRILLKRIPHLSKWEIVLETSGKRILLSNMGTGLKTILLILSQFIIIPSIRRNKHEDYIFVIEEPENNLHPALLRRLLKYIEKKVIETNSTLFITTHSNIVIDSYSHSISSQVLHLINDKSVLKFIQIQNLSDKLNIFENLHYKASDLLQANCIIWVEGPSDRIYINKWIYLVTPSLKEGFHYSIMFYGGRLLKNLSCDKKECNENEINDFISLIKINPNIILVMDSDKESDEDVVNETKLRIEKELGKEHSWITAGREIENYLSERAINKWLNYAENVNLKFEKFNKILENFKNYSKDKHESSKEIVKFIDENDLDIYDLKEKISSICQKIRKWNFMDYSY